VAAGAAQLTANLLAATAAAANAAAARPPTLPLDGESREEARAGAARTTFAYWWRTFPYGGRGEPERGGLWSGRAYSADGGPDRGGGAL